jgi:hypothetical protein
MIGTLAAVVVEIFMIVTRPLPSVNHSICHCRLARMKLNQRVQQTLMQGGRVGLAPHLMR